MLLEQTAINPVVVHGGGPQIEAMLKRAGVQSQFAGGLRITDAATLEIVEMVLAGSINKQIVGYINAAGGKAIGLCGKDGNMVIAQEGDAAAWSIPDSNIEKVVDLGFVGEPDKVDTTVLDTVLGTRADPGAGAGRGRRRRRHASTSTPTRSPAPSPARSRPSAFCCSPTCRACSTSRSS